MLELIENILHHIVSRIDLLITAFLSIYVSFISSLIFHNYKKNEEIKENHLKALKYLQKYFVDQIEIIELNLDIAKNYIDYINKYKNSNISDKLKFSIAQLLEFETNVYYIFDLKNNDFGNDLLHNLRVTKRLNFKSKALLQYVYICNEGLIKGNTDNEKYKILMLALLEDFTDIQNSLIEHLNNTEILFAKLNCRINIDKRMKKKFLFFKDFSISKNYEKDFDKMVEKEVELLKQNKINTNDKQ